MHPKRRDGIIRGTCKHCGRILILEPSRRRSHHEAPTCAAYDRLTVNARRLAPVEVGDDGLPKPDPS